MGLPVTDQRVVPLPVQFIDDTGDKPGHGKLAAGTVCFRQALHGHLRLQDFHAGTIEITVAQIGQRQQHMHHHLVRGGAGVAA